MPRNRKGVTGPDNAHFRPPETGSLERWLGAITEIGGEVVELDGRTLPRVREPSPEPWTTLARAAGFGRTGLESIDTLARFVLECEAEDAVLGYAPKRRGHNLRTCMEVSYSRWIEARPVVDHLEMDLADELGFTGTERARSVRKVTRKGDVHWASLGAWPWALFPEGRFPSRWRRNLPLASELETWHARAQQEAMLRHARERGRLRRAHRLSQPRSE